MDKGRRVFLKSLLTGSALVVAQSFGGGLISKVLADGDTRSAIKAYDLPVFQPKGAVGKGFPQSIAAGDPTATGAILWTRVDPAEEKAGLSGDDFDMSLVQWLDSGSKPPNKAVRQAIEDGQFIMVEVSEVPTFNKLAMRCYTPIWNGFDHVAKVDLDGHLESKKTYYYRFITKSGLVSQTGRFKTLPSKGAHLPSVKIGQLTCQDYTNGYFHAVRNLAEEELDFVVHLGDYIYAEVEYGTVAERKIQLPSGADHAFTIDDYRFLYQTIKSDKDLQLLHQNHAMVAIWDDHEFANDTYYPAIAPDDSDQSNPGRRLIANQAWFEYTPARVHFDRKQKFSEFQIYRSIAIGDLAELILTDERLYRDAPPCGSKSSDKFFANGCDKMFDPNQSMFGNQVSKQRDWFLDRMQKSKNVWKIWANGVQFTPMKILGRYMNLDAWDGYSGERKIITSELKKAGIKNWIILTGDLHSYEAAIVKDDFKKDRDEEALGVEFMVGSINSANYADMAKDKVRGILPMAKKRKSSNSYPIPEEAFDEILSKIDAGKLIEDAQEKAKKNKIREQDIMDDVIDKILEKIFNLVSVENPWLKLFNSTTYGYAVLELSHNKATWSAYSVEDIKSPTSTGKSLLFQCEVPRDQAELRILKD